MPKWIISEGTREGSCRKESLWSLRGYFFFSLDSSRWGEQGYLRRQDDPRGCEWDNCKILKGRNAETDHFRMKKGRVLPKRVTLVATTVLLFSSDSSRWAEKGYLRRQDDPSRCKVNKRNILKCRNGSLRRVEEADESQENERPSLPYFSMRSTWQSIC